MTTPDRILDRVETALEALVRLGEGHDGLFPSMIDLEGRGMLDSAPAAIPGQRDGDRAWRGSNLIHDEPTLMTLRALGPARGRHDLAAAADRYLERFARHCTRTASGLFPWGEHAFWDLDADAIGDSHRRRDGTRLSGAIHDHLRAAPPWLWERLHHHDATCVQAFADGLVFHWTEGTPREYIRHAFIEQRRPYPRGARSCDFPRHGGFYICDWAFAHAVSGRPGPVDQIRLMVEYWWPRRDDRGLLQIESRSPEEDDRFYDVNAPAQTLSLAVSLLEAATLLREAHPELAATMTARAATYVDGFFAAPHDLEAGVYVILSRRSTNQVLQTMPIWGSVYGVWPAAYAALTALYGFRQTGDERLLDWAASVGHRTMGAPLPAGLHAPAMDLGLGLGLLADLYDLTGQPRWLDGGLDLAHRLLDTCFTGTLPAGATGIDWYESQMGPGFLLHGLARIALLARDQADCPLAADYTAR